MCSQSGALRLPLSFPGPLIQGCVEGGGPPGAGAGGWGQRRQAWERVLLSRGRKCEMQCS